MTRRYISDSRRERETRDLVPLSLGQVLDATRERDFEGCLKSGETKGTGDNGASERARARTSNDYDSLRGHAWITVSVRGEILRLSRCVSLSLEIIPARENGDILSDI